MQMRSHLITLGVTQLSAHCSHHPVGFRLHKQNPRVLVILQGFLSEMTENVKGLKTSPPTPRPSVPLPTLHLQVYLGTLSYLFYITAHFCSWFRSGYRRNTQTILIFSPHLRLIGLDGGHKCVNYY